MRSGKTEYQKHYCTGYALDNPKSRQVMVSKNASRQFESMRDYLSRRKIPHRLQIVFENEATIEFEDLSDIGKPVIGTQKDVGDVMGPKPDDPLPLTESMFRNLCGRVEITDNKPSGTFCDAITKMADENQEYFNKFIEGKWEELGEIDDGEG